MRDNKNVVILFLFVIVLLMFYSNNILINLIENMRKVNENYSNLMNVSGIFLKKEREDGMNLNRQLITNSNLLIHKINKKD
jgi:hypothetical protein